MYIYIYIYVKSVGARPCCGAWRCWYTLAPSRYIVYIYIYICMHIHIHICIYIHTYIHTCIRTYIYIYIYMSVLYIYICISLFLGAAPHPLVSTGVHESHRYCDEKVATMLFEALRAALRVVVCRFVFFEALRAHSSCSHLCHGDSGGA